MEHYVCAAAFPGRRVPTLPGGVVAWEGHHAKVTVTLGQEWTRAGPRAA